MNKKGFMMEMLAFLVIGIFAVVFFGLLIYGFDFIRDTLSTNTIDTASMNLSYYSNATIGKLADGMNNLQLIAIILMVGYIIATFITAYYSTRHPIWLFVYIMITILMMIFAVYISNAYESIRADTEIAGMITGFTVAGYMILYLPYIIGIVGLVGITLSIVGVTMSRRVFE